MKFSCSSSQVQQSALDFYLNNFQEVQSVTLLNIVSEDPLEESCRVLFKWTHREDLGAATGQDFCKFEFWRVTSDSQELACLFAPKGMTGGAAGPVDWLSPWPPRSSYSGEISVQFCKEKLADGKGRELDARCGFVGIWPSCQYVDASCDLCTSDGDEDKFSEAGKKSIFGRLDDYRDPDPQYCWNIISRGMVGFVALVFLGIGCVIILYVPS